MPAQNTFNELQLLQHFVGAARKMRQNRFPKFSAASKELFW